MKTSYSERNNQMPDLIYFSALVDVILEMMLRCENSAWTCGLDSNEAQAIVHTFFMYMHERQDPHNKLKPFEYKTIEELRAYCQQSLKFAFKRIVKKQQSAQSLDEDDNYELFAQVDDYQIADVSIQELISDLKEQAQSVLIRKIDYGYTHKEIAQELHISVGLSRKTHSRGLQKLKESFELPERYQAIYKECICGKKTVLEFAEEHGITVMAATLLKNGAYAYIIENYLSVGI